MIASSTSAPSTTRPRARPASTTTALRRGRGQGLAHEQLRHRPSASITVVGNTPSSRHKPAMQPIAASMPLLTSCAVRHVARARPPEKGHAVSLDEAGGGQRRGEASRAAVTG